MTGSSRGALAMALGATLCCDGATHAPPPPELTATITSPEESSPVSGPIVVVVDVEPEAEVVGVEFALIRDGLEHRVDTDLTPPFESVLAWDGLDDGPKTISVTAVGRAGQVASDRVVVLVDNLMPEVEILEPSPDDVVFVEDESASFSVRAWDGSGIESVSMTIEGQPLVSISEGPGDTYIGEIDLSRFADEVGGDLLDIELTANAEDPFGRETTVTTSLGIAKRLFWHAVLPSPVAGRAASSPDGSGVYVATEAGTVHALDFSTGSEICRSTTEGEGFRGPAVSREGTVYWGTGNGLRAISGAPSCENLWTLRAGEVAQGKPTVEESSGWIFFATREGGLHLASADGSTLQSRGDVGLVRSAPTVIPERRLVVVSSADYFLHALEYTDTYTFVEGINWRAETGGELEASAAVHGDRLYVGSNDFNLYSFSIVDGTRIPEWDAPFATTRQITTAPYVDSEGFVYATSRDRACYRISTDRELSWSYVVESGISYSAPVVDEDADLVLFGETGATGPDGILHGVIHAVGRTTGEVAWTASVDGSIASTPLVEEGLVVIGASSGLVYAYFIDGVSARRALE